MQRRHAVGDLAAVEHAQALGGGRVRHPHAALGVEADAVRPPVRGEVGEDAAARQRAVGGHVERRQPPPARLRHDQRAPVRRDDRAVRELEAVRRLAHLAVLGDERERRRAHPAVGEDVRAEVADVGAAPRVDDHVVAVPRRHRRQVGDLLQPAGRDVAHQLAVRHRDDEQRPVGRPAEAGGPVPHLDDRLGVPAGVDGHHLVAPHVGEPQLAVAPARPLAEAQAAEQLAGLVFGHRSSSSRVRP